MELDNSNDNKYRMSAIELMQDHTYYTDFDLNLNLNLVDREIYSTRKGIIIFKVLDIEENLTEKDKYLLSSSNAVQRPHGSLSGLNRPKLTQKDKMYDKKNQWGENVTDPLAVRNLAQQDADNIIMTNEEDSKHKDQEIAKISQSFEDNKEVVEMAKPSNPNVSLATDKISGDREYNYVRNDSNVEFKEDSTAVDSNEQKKRLAP